MIGFGHGWQHHKKSQHGAAAVEFAIIAMVFFTLLLAIIEFGRFMFVWNTAQEVTRCAARHAVVVWKDNWEGTPDIRQQCLFGQANLPAGNEIGIGNVRLRALNSALTEADPADVNTSISNCVNDQTDPECIRYVEASLWCDGGDNCNTTTHRVKYMPMIGLFPFLNIDIPASTVVMPAESMGYHP